MTTPNVIVDWYYSGGTSYYTAPNGTVTSVSWNTGRQNITDQWSGSTATVYGRLPSSLTYSPQIGQRVRIQVYTGSSSYVAAFWGYVSDYRVIYGWTSAYDTWEMTLETGYGLAGRQVSTVSSSAGALTNAFVDTIVAAMPTNSMKNAGGFSTNTSAQTYTSQITAAINAALFTDCGFMVDSVYTSAPDFWPATYLNGHQNMGLGDGGTYTDVSTDPTSSARYQNIEFQSSAYNYGQKVVVQASGLADQSSGSGTYAQTVQTINYTTAQAADVAGYLQAEFNYSATVPFSLTFVGASNSDYTVIRLGNAAQIGTAATVKFRGTTYQCIVQGLRFSANATDYQVTLYLSSSLQNAFLRLDNTVFGTLDNNRLGF